MRREHAQDNINSCQIGPPVPNRTLADPTVMRITYLFKDPRKVSPAALCSQEAHRLLVLFIRVASGNQCYMKTSATGNFWKAN